MEEYNFERQEGEFRETNYEKKFGDAGPLHDPNALTCAKQAMIGAAAAFVGGIASFIIAVFLSKVYIALAAIAPVGVVIGLIYAINSLRIDKGIPLAYVALVLNILGLVPGIYCAWLLILSLIY